MSHINSRNTEEIVIPEEERHLNGNGNVKQIKTSIRKWSAKNI